MSRIYGGRSASERRAARRERLLAAAIECFGTRGYAATTIEQICTTASVTARHFYEEFESREALLRAVFDAIATAVLAGVRAAIYAPGKSAVAAVRDGAAAYFEAVTADPRRARILVLEVVGVSPALERHRRAVLGTFIGEMLYSSRRLEAAGILPTIDLPLLAAALVGAAQELTTEWVLAEDPPRVERLIDLVSAIWIRALELDRRRPVEGVR